MLLDKLAAPGGGAHNPRDLEAMKLVLKIAAVAALTALAVPARAQNSASSTTATTATVIRAITITPGGTALTFGTIVENGAGPGTAVVDATTGARSYTGGVTGTPGTSGSNAVYTVGGEGGQAFSTTVPATFTLAGPSSSSLTVTTSTTTLPTALSGSLGAAGTASFSVGGSIPILATTTTGAYTGNLTVTVAYN